MRTLLCAIGRMENDYIREWVEYNKNIGFTNICLFDNNFDGEQDFRDVIGDYIESGYVILKDYRNRIVCQLKAYTECYSEYGNKYDWIAFFDVDEFLTFSTHKNIQEYLSDKMFNDFYSIKINCLNYDDNDMLYNDGRPLLERFKRPMPLYQNYTGNELTQCLIRGQQKIKLNQNDTGFYFLNPGTTDIYPCCDGGGIEKKFDESSFLPNFKYSCLRHYSTKTAREYCDKIRRGFPDHDITLYPNRELWLVENVFFKVNSVTPEKVQIFKDVLDVDVSHLLK